MKKNHAYSDDWYILVSTKAFSGGIHSTECHSYMNILFGSLRFVVNISFALSMLLAVVQCHKWKMWLQTV